MKKYYNIFTLLVVALVGLSLTACSEDDLDTNQYQQGVYLNVYGPSPVMRGGMLRFLGSNLNNVVSVTLPGCSPITSIEVIQAGVPSEIRIQVPKDGPEEGLVKLVTNTDQEIWTKTKLLYTEPIVIEGFTPASVMPGDNVTITGDYLNLVHMVEFAEGVQVSESAFVSHDRYSIVVTVPEDAKTGKISLYTADLTVTEAASSVDYNIMQTDDVLEVGTPTITKLSSPRGEAEAQGTIEAKAGETITLTGTYFNLAQAIKIGGVEITELTISTDAKTLSFKLLAEAPDAEILLVTKSGVEVPSGLLLTVAPTVTAVTPQPVKAGATLTITGADLDLVAAVNFPNADGVEFTANATTLVVTAVPETAQEGDIVLVKANGKEVTAALTLVKPTITAYNANPVSAGAELQVTGTDLDLVKTITFGEGTATVEEGKVSADGTTLTVTVPMEAISGAPKFNLANGISVDGPELTINEAVFCYAVELPDEDAENKAGSTMSIIVANGDKLTGVQMNGVDCQWILTGEDKNQLIIGIPETAKANSTLRLISSNGEITYNVAVIPATEVTKVLWSGMIDLDWGLPNAIYLDASAFDDIPAGARMTLTYTVQNGIWTQIWFEAGDEVHLVFTDTSDGALAFDRSLVPSSVYDWDWSSTYNLESTVVLTQDVLDLIREKGIFNIRGGNRDDGSTILTKLAVTYANSLETTIWENEWVCSSWNGNQDLAWGGFDWTTVKAGAILSFYYKKNDDWGCISLRHGDNWGALPEPIPGQYDLEGTEGVVSVTFTQDVLDDLIANGGLVLTGDNYTLTKVTVE